MNKVVRALEDSEKLSIEMAGYGPHSKLRLKTLPEYKDQDFCAESHCQGQCGLPGLFVQALSEAESLAPDLASRHKVHGDMVACGPVLQRKPWDGQGLVLMVPQERLQKLIKDWWWW